jgi:nucleotide sugar dehydrogenase
MSSSTLYANAEEINTSEKRGKFTIGIIGCDLTGVFHACLFAEKGFKVICADENQAIANTLSKGKSAFLNRETETRLKAQLKNGHLSVTNDIKEATKSDIVVLTTKVEVDQKRKTNYAKMESVLKKIGSDLRRGSLVIVATEVGVSVVEDLIQRILEDTSGLKAGVDFGLAYSPVRLSKTQTIEDIVNQERIVAATDKAGLVMASSILGIISRNVKVSPNIKTAEAAILFEAVTQGVNRALDSELAIFCERAGLDYSEACALVESTDVKTLSLRRIGENFQKELLILLENAENLDLKLRIPATAGEVNEETVRHIVKLTRDSLRDCEKTLKRARIALLGIVQTPNMKSAPRKVARRIAEMLDAKGAKISLHDPYLSSNELGESKYPFKNTLTEAVEGADCIILLTEHEQFRHLNLKKLKIIMRKKAAIIDLSGILKPDEVEKEGFIYRKLGKGVGAK